MQTKYPLFLFAVAILFCGCDKQAKINNEKINLLSQKIVQLEQSQAKQMAVIQSELTTLAPKMERIDSSYFEKNRDDALFFHTNTLFLLLTVGKQIEAQLQTAAAEREVQNALAFSYHTNQLGTLFLCTAQLEEAMNLQEGRLGNALTNQENRIRGALAEQEKRLEENVLAASKQASAALGDSLSNQIKQAAVPDADAEAQRAKMATDIAQLQRDLAAIKTRLTTNPPSRFW